MKWEYKVIDLSKSNSNALLEEFLNSYAINGWEFVSVLSEDNIFYRVLLKRNELIKNTLESKGSNPLSHAIIN